MSRARKLEPWEEATLRVEHLQRNLDITDADHIALFIERNFASAEPLDQFAGWLAHRILDAHEAEVARRLADPEEYFPAEPVDGDDPFLTITLSRNGGVTGVDHPADAGLEETIRAYRALRDWLEGEINQADEQVPA